MTFSALQNSSARDAHWTSGGQRIPPRFLPDPWPPGVRLLLTDGRLSFVPQNEGLSADLAARVALGALPLAQPYHIYEMNRSSSIFSQA